MSEEKPNQLQILVLYHTHVPHGGRFEGGYSAESKDEYMISRYNRAQEEIQRRLQSPDFDYDPRLAEQYRARKFFGIATGESAAKRLVDNLRTKGMPLYGGHAPVYLVHGQLEFIRFASGQVHNGSVDMITEALIEAEAFNPQIAANLRLQGKSSKDIPEHLKEMIPGFISPDVKTYVESRFRKG